MREKSPKCGGTMVVKGAVSRKEEALKEVLVARDEEAKERCMEA